MASWKDGAEYAPIERPNGFATPVATALEDAAPYRAATPGAGEAPSTYQQAASVPLDQLLPRTATPRDPRAPFDVASAMLTGDSAWGATHRADQPHWTPSFDPRQPLLPTSIGTGTATSFAPPNPATRLAEPPPGLPFPGQQAPPRPVGLTTANKQMLWVAAGLLALGAWIPSTALFTLLVSSVLFSRASGRNQGVIVFAVAIMVAALTTIIGLDTATFSAISSLLCLACLGVVAVVGVRNRNS